MIKTIIKVLITILTVTAAIFYFTKTAPDLSWGGYTPLIFKSGEDSEKGIELLRELGFNNIIHENSISVGINNYFDMEERSLNNIESTLNKNDSRYDSFISSVSKLFVSSRENEEVIYLKLGSNELLRFYNIYSTFSKNAISYKIGNLSFIRTIFNYISFLLIILIFGIGSKTRFVASVLAGVGAFFFMDASSFYNYISFILGYFIIIMLIESFSFSNRYIKRNNIGIGRILLFVIIFSAPTFIPTILDYSTSIYSPVAVGSDGFDYSNLEDAYDSESPSISNYFTHYAYQKSFLYGEKYMFPTYENSVTMNEFIREDYYISGKTKVVEEYNEAFLSDFISYCNTTVLGRFYLDYGRPFKLELNSLLSLYILNKEYLQVGVLALFILVASLILKKGGDKKLKY